MSSVYESEECSLLARAVEYAWEMFLKAGRLTAQNIHIARAALTYAALEAADKGERNPRRLAVAAVAGAEKFEHRLRFDRLPRENAPSLSWESVQTSGRIASPRECAAERRL